MMTIPKQVEEYDLYVKDAAEMTASHALSIDPLMYNFCPCTDNLPSVIGPYLSSLYSRPYLAKSRVDQQHPHENSTHLLVMHQ